MLTNIVKKHFVSLYTVVNTNQKGSYQGSADRSYSFKRRDFADTARRARPSDLFLFGTGRITKTTVQTDTGFNMVTNGTYYENESVLSLYPSNSTFRVDGGGTTLKDPVTTVSRERMYNSIRNELRGKEVNLANNLGEYRQAASLFRELAEVVHTRGMSLIKRHRGFANKRRGKADVASSLANVNLQFNYGIKPLAQDMGTALGELNSAVQRPPPYVNGVVKRRDMQSNIGFVQPNSTVVSRWADSAVTVETRMRTEWRAYFKCNYLVAALAQHGMLNPASLAWELMPYSFVIDWWMNVGETLASLDNLLMYDSLYVLDSTSVRRGEFVTTRPNSVILSKGQSFQYVRTDTRLSPSTVSLVVTPMYKPSLSHQHILNGLSLLQQLRGR